MPILNRFLQGDQALIGSVSTKPSEFADNALPCRADFFAMAIFHCILPSDYPLRKLSSTLKNATTRCAD